MFPVKLLKKAEKDLKVACEWYEEKQHGLGGRFFTAVDNQIGLISKNPLQYNLRFSERYRFAPTTGFPYLIVYRFDEFRREIIILAIFHTSRNPLKF
ncbi:type II toxin-antitoxin system RelE/ParE family toxin [Mucilaginibacter pallidiroseus]|uniref:Type II toxin-antitoxin system RelE/ParE family toxin n=1 Tax=Mucilaginibacter pallidiroseus TaxID=2599295 RepID=A0A563UDD9_9SPHI|nr:type II toxin-antitoxin system RelE/ParE family toxin [Mucilaginibacter pallidiroseus]